MREQKFCKRCLTWVLVLMMTLSLLPVSALAADGEEIGEASAGNLNLTVGFKVRMNPKSGEQIDKVCSDGETLDVDPDIYTSAYIRPYIEVDGTEFEAPNSPR